MRASARSCQARSQIAEALLRSRGAGRVEARSAGSAPAERVNPGALRVLAAHGVDHEGHPPTRTEAVLGLGWDVVITVCDQARESCPVLPSATLTAHWDVEDPVGAPDEADAFEEAYEVLSRRIDDLLAVDLGEFDPQELELELARIGRDDPRED